MKPNKHIKSVASELYQAEMEVNPKTCKTPNYFERELGNIKEALLKGRFYAQIKQTSKSGMSRRLRLCYIKDNELYCVLNARVLRLAGLSKDGRISGCGDDFRFSAQYNLWLALIPEKPCQDMPSYNAM